MHSGLLPLVNILAFDAAHRYFTALEGWVLVVPVARHRSERHLPVTDGYQRPKGVRFRGSVG